MDLIHLDFDRLEDAGRSFLSLAITQATACIENYVNNGTRTISVLDKELRALIIKYFCCGLLGFKHSRFLLQRVGQEPGCIERRRKIDFAFEEACCFTHARTHVRQRRRRRRQRRVGAASVQGYCERSRLGSSYSSSVDTKLSEIHDDDRFRCRHFEPPERR